MKKYLITIVALLIIPVLSGMAIAGDAGAVFSLGPNMNTARMAHYSATLADGREVLFGGHGTNFVSLNTAEVWSPSANSFSTIQMNYTHDAAAFARLADERYLIAGGADDLGVAPGFNTAEIYNPSDNSFTPTGKMTYPRMNIAAATLTSGKVLVVGGWYDSNSAAYGELYDPAAGKFTATKALNTSRAVPVILPTNDGKAVVFGGMGVYGNPGSIEQVELYDPATNSFSILQDALFTGESGWTIYGSANIPRSIETQKLSDGRYLLIAWKSSGNITQYTLFTFDPNTKQFAKLNTTPALPDSSTVGLGTPIVNQAKSKAYLFSYVLPYASPIKVRLYTVDLAANMITTPSDSYTLPDSTYVASMGSTLLKDGRIFLTGGHSQTGYNTNFSPIKNTFFAVPTEAAQPAGPAAPQNMRYTIGNNNMITIQWDASTGASGYILGLGASTGVYIATADVGNITQLGPFPASLLSPGTYYIVVKAYNGTQQSSYSNEIAVTISQSGNLQAPANLRYTLNGTVLTVNWDAVTGAKGYKLGLGMATGNYFGPYDVGNITQIGPLDISSVSAGTYYFAVKAYNGSGESGYSNEIAVSSSGGSTGNYTQGDMAGQDAFYRSMVDSFSMTTGALVQATLAVNSVLYTDNSITDVEAFKRRKADADAALATLQKHAGNTEAIIDGIQQSSLLQIRLANLSPNDVLATVASGPANRQLRTLMTTYKIGAPAAKKMLDDAMAGLITEYNNDAQFYDKATRVATLVKEGSGLALTVTGAVVTAGGVTGALGVIDATTTLITGLDGVIKVTKAGAELALGKDLPTPKGTMGAIATGLSDASELIGIAGLNKWGEATDKIANIYTIVTKTRDILQDQQLNIGAQTFDLTTWDWTNLAWADLWENMPTTLPGTYKINGVKTEVKDVPDTIKNIIDRLPPEDKLTSLIFPAISNLSPNSGQPGDTVTITGKDFGATQGTSTVTLAGTAAQVVSWSNTSIVIKVPSTSSTGNVIVTVGGAASNGALFTVLNQCSTQQVAGADTPETRIIDLGINHGTFQFSYETYSQQDQIIVSYQGNILFDSGCVGASGTQSLTYSGNSTTVTVSVHPNCAGGTGTQWNFTVSCPQ